MLKYVFLSMALLIAPIASAKDAEIQATISNQIEAFKSDDFVAAFEYASPMIQGIFGNPSNFGAMVKGGYPMVARPASVDFLDLREIAGRLFQQVQVQGPDGAFYVLDYEMIQLNGIWRINGVQILPGRQYGA